MQLGRLLLRTTVGEVFVVHGAQKVFGAFGGYGPEGTGQFFESLGLRPGKRTRWRRGPPRPPVASCSPWASRRRPPRQA